MFDLQLGPLAEREPQRGLWHLALNKNLLLTPIIVERPVQRKIQLFLFHSPSQSLFSSQTQQFVWLKRWLFSVFLLFTFWVTRNGSFYQNVTNLNKWYNRTKTSRRIEQKCTYVWSPVWSPGRKWTTVTSLNLHLYKNPPWKGSKPLSPVTLFWFGNLKN